VSRSRHDRHGLDQRHLDVAGVLGCYRAAQALVDAGDLLRIALGHQHAVKHLRVGDEVSRLGALLGGVDVRDHDVGLTRLQRGQKRRKGDRLVAERKAQAGADRLAQIDVKADVLARILRIDGLVAGCVRIDRVDQLLALELGILGLKRRAFGRRLGNFGMGLPGQTETGGKGRAGEHATCNARDRPDLGCAGGRGPWQLGFHCLKAPVGADPASPAPALLLRTNSV
jgi:hypothetical protein